MNRITIGVGALLPVVCVFSLIGGLGPLDPPTGPVAETGPSLSDIEDKIDALNAIISTSFDSGQNRNVQVLYLESGTPSEHTAIQITSGPTRVLGVAGFLSQAVLFDGPGSFTGGSSGAATGEVLGRLSRDQIQVIGSGRGQSFVNRVSNGYPINVVADNGLYLAHAISGYLIVYYEEIQ